VLAPQKEVPAVGDTYILVREKAFNDWLDRVIHVFQNRIFSF
jgi:hypothetical protein